MKCFYRVNAWLNLRWRLAGHFDGQFYLISTVNRVQKYFEKHKLIQIKKNWVLAEEKKLFQLAITS